MKRLKAFFLGVVEFRLNCTTVFSDNDMGDAYDAGREWAHRLTFRRFDR